MDRYFCTIFVRYYYYSITTYCKYSNVFMPVNIRTYVKLKSYSKKSKCLMNGLFKLNCEYILWNDNIIRFNDFVIGGIMFL